MYENHTLCRRRIESLQQQLSEVPFWCFMWFMSGAFSVLGFQYFFSN